MADNDNVPRLHFSLMRQDDENQVASWPIKPPKLRGKFQKKHNNSLGNIHFKSGLRSTSLASKVKSYSKQQDILRRALKQWMDPQSIRAIFFDATHKGVNAYKRVLYQSILQWKISVARAREADAKASHPLILPHLFPCALYSLPSTIWTYPCDILGRCYPKGSSNVGGIHDGSVSPRRSLHRDAAEVVGHPSVV